MASVNRHSVLLKNLPTRSVTLYPARALVCREVPDLELKPGANEVEIYGLTPTMDEHSIKVDGIGSASVTDMTIDLVPNKETFSQAFPVDDEFEESDIEDDTDDELADSAEVKKLRSYVAELDTKIQTEINRQAGIFARDNYLKQWYSGLQGKDNTASQVADFLDTFQTQSMAFDSERIKSQLQRKQLVQEKERKDRQLSKLTHASRQAKRKAAADRAKKEKEERLRKQAEWQEKQRIQDERAKYWPKKVYKVTIHLDVPTDTPSTSRRSSMTSVTLAKDQPQEEEGSSAGAQSQLATLQLSYITLSASWAPRYDVEFNTAQKSGKITYRAEFTNHTSETWDQAKISLSTSQASFRGLDDEAPWMHPWHISLTKGFRGSGTLMSTEERNSKAQGQKHGNDQPQQDRSELFGRNDRQTVELHEAQASGARKLQVPRGESSYACQNSSMPQSAGLFGGFRQNDAPSQARRAQFGSEAAHAPQPPSQGSSLFAQPSTTNALSTSANQSSTAPMAQTAAGGRPTDAALYYPASSHAIQEPMVDRVEKNMMGHSEMLKDMISSSQDKTVDFNDTTREDHGLTTTYDIPGTRTLEPSSLTRRHKIASLPFSNLTLTSICIPKLRPAAFMRARFRNPSSSISLPRGTAGLTLDGTFLGNTTLPRLSPGELATLPLGVDPSLHVSYAQPVTKRSTQGIFNKEAAQVFTRSILLTNTKTVPVEIVVLDQVPVSEDEKLKVEIVEPRGLHKEGDMVATGVNAQESKTMTAEESRGMRESGRTTQESGARMSVSGRNGGKGSWGSAKSTLKKNGEIAYNVLLEKGGACRLGLEFEARAPTSENITSK